MADMFKVGFEADTKGLKQADTALDDMARAADKTEDAVEDLNDELVRSTKITPKVTAVTKKAVAETKKSAKAFKLQKGAMQQAGYQVQDFSVQMAGGTSFLTAFGQQASQLAGVLGPGGAVIGAVIAVSAAIGGVLVKTLFTAGEESDRFVRSLGDLQAEAGKLEKIELSSLIATSDKDIRVIEKLIVEIKKGDEGVIQRQKDSLVLRTDSLKKEKAWLRIKAYNDNIIEKTGKRTLHMYNQQFQASQKYGKADLKYTENKEILLTKQARIIEAEGEIKDIKNQQLDAQNRIIELNGGTVSSLNSQQKLTAQILQDTKDSIQAQQGKSQFSDEVQKAQQAGIRAATDARFKAIKLEAMEEATKLKALKLQNERLLDAQNNLFIKQYDNLVFSNLSQEEQLEQSRDNRLASLEQYAETQIDFESKKNEMIEVIQADHLAKMAALESKSIAERGNTLSSSLTAVDQAFSIIGNLESARNAGRKAELEADLRNSQNFTQAQIANKTKEAKGIFEAQNEADKASIASSTAAAMMTQAATGNWGGVAVAFALGAKQYAHASAQKYNGSTSPGGGNTQAPPPSQNNTTNSNNGGNTNTFHFNGAPTGDGLEALKQALADGDIMFSADSAQAQVLQS